MKTNIPVQFIGEATAARMVRVEIIRQRQQSRADRCADRAAAFLADPPNWFFVALGVISAACLVIVLR